MYIIQVLYSRTPLSGPPLGLSRSGPLRGVVHLEGLLRNQNENMICIVDDQQIIVYLVFTSKHHIYRHKEIRYIKYIIILDNCTFLFVDSIYFLVPWPFSQCKYIKVQNNSTFLCVDFIYLLVPWPFTQCNAHNYILVVT